jgi:LysR family glycine cleavage system transcriptional activator
MKMRTLPPFDALVAFDTALRHRSMTRAATELGMTQSAVSHRLRRLEAFVGTPLLSRSSDGLSATPAGAELANGLGELLDGLADLRGRCRALVAPAGLRVAVGSALADYWLLRRLPRFTRAHRRLEVEFGIVENELQARAADADVQILWQPIEAARSTSTQRLLFHEQVFPVCAPHLLPGGRLLRDPTGLAELPLVHKGPPGGRGQGAEWSWPVWFGRLGIERRPPAGLRCAALGTAIAAALEGAGVVLARSLLVHDALADGRLVRVLPARWDMPSSKAHVVRWPAALGADRRVRTFVDWISAEARATTGKREVRHSAG